LDPKPCCVEADSRTARRESTEYVNEYRIGPPIGILDFRSGPLYDGTDGSSQPGVAKLTASAAETQPETDRSEADRSETDQSGNSYVSTAVSPISPQASPTIAITQNESTSTLSRLDILLASKEKIRTENHRLSKLKELEDIEAKLQQDIEEERRRDIEGG
jgi:hypothetical protein